MISSFEIQKDKNNQGFFFYFAADLLEILRSPVFSF